MEHTTVKRKWANWKLVALVIILLAIFIKFFVIAEKEENLAAVTELDLEKVAFRSHEEVEALLGKGKLDSYYKDIKADCEKCPKMIYREGKIEIIFINEIADWITIRNFSDFDFGNRVILGLLGLKDNIKPIVDNGDLKQWNKYQKYSQIAAFRKDGKVDYILVKSKTL